MRLTRLELLVLLLVAWNGLYFYTGYGWNAIARYDQVFSLVEPDANGQHTWHIDRFICDPVAGHNTGDWAQNLAHDAHYYPNKAPGTALFGVLAYAPLYALERLVGMTPQAPLTTYYNTYLINLFVSVLPCVLAAVCFLRLLLTLHPGRPRWAVFGVVTLFGGTLVFPYATNLTGHAAAAGWLVVATYAATRRTTRGDACAGFAGGLAVLLEFPAAIPLACLLVYLGWGGTWRRVAWAILGGSGPLAVYMAFHWICFGNPLTPATVWQNPMFADTGRVGGMFGGFAHHAVYGLLASPYRGLFWHMPVLLAVLLVLPRLWRRTLPAMGWVALAAAGGYLLMALSFNNWHGGSRFGPAYVAASLPFWVILLSYAVLPRAQLWRVVCQVVLVLLLALSVSNMLLGAALCSRVGMSPNWPDKPNNWDNPLALYYAKLFAGDLHPWLGKDIIRLAPGPDGKLRPWVDPAHPLPVNINLGEELTGLPLNFSLLPWLLGLALLLGGMWRATAKEPGGIPASGPGSGAHG